MRQPSLFKFRFYNIAIGLVLLGGLISSVHGEITVRGQVLDTNGRAVKQAQVTIVPGALAAGIGNRGIHDKCGLRKPYRRRHGISRSRQTGRPDRARPKFVRTRTGRTIRYAGASNTDGRRGRLRQPL